MKKITLSIRTKVMLLTLLPIILCGVLLEGLIYTKASPLLIESELLNLKKAALFYKSNFAQQLQPTQQELLTLADTLAQKKADKKALSASIETFLRQHPAFISVSLVNQTTQRELLSVQRTDEYTIVSLSENHLNKQHNQFIKQAMLLKKGQIHLSSFSLTQSQLKTTPELIPSVQLATPYPYQDNTHVLLIVSLNATGLLNKAIPAQLKNTIAYLTNQKGVILSFLTNKNHPLQLTQTIQGRFPETQALLTENNQPLEIMLFPGQKNDFHYVFATTLHYTPLDDKYFLAVVISSAKETLLAQVNEKLLFLLSMGVLGIFALSFLTYFFIQKITQPLQELVFASHHLGNDFSTLNFPTDSNDELAALAQSLENMNRTIIKQNEALKNTALMNQSIMNNMSDALITIDEEGVVNFFNTEAEQLFNYSAEEIKGKSIALLIPETYQSDYASYLNRYFEKDRVKLLTQRVDIEMMGLKKDGSTFPLELSVTEMILQRRKATDKTFFIGLCRNIEARKTAEQNLKRAEEIAIVARKEAEKANAAKSQFLSKMSHEFKTPLNAILGFSQIELYDKNSTSDKSQIQSIYDAGNHLLTMVNDVLDLSTLEIGEINLSLEAVAVSDFFKEIYQECLLLAQEKQITVELHLAIDQACFINVDRSKLKQILLNLTTNAVKFNRNNGFILLCLTRLYDDTIEFSIEDQGVGIAMNKLGLIFKPFERLNAYDQGIDGLGIGLMIAKQLTESMGGTIGVESIENEGSRFYVCFPLALPEENYG